jgi:Tol biopolymer transport system component
VDFLPDGRRVIVAGRPVKDRSDYVLATLDVRTGELTQLAKGTWLSDAAISPSGDWIAYMVSLDSEHPENNGLWLVPTSEGTPRRLPFVGSYRWRDNDRLAYIPMTLDADSDELWELDARTNSTRRLLEAGTPNVAVANADWSISPGGRHFLYRSAEDLSLRLVRLP